MACACQSSQQHFGMACTCGSPCSCQPTTRVVLVQRQPLAPLGELRGVIYRKPGLPGEAAKNYVHFFDRTPLLAADPMGHRLFIIGGRYRVTKRGIEG